MDTSTSQHERGGGRADRRAFTLVELLVVVAILTLLFMLLAPAIQSAVERSRISNCSSILHHISIAQAQYVADNHDYLNPYCFNDTKAYEVLPVGIDGNGNPYDLRYGCCYDYHNLLAPYLGLGNCMPVQNTTGNWWPQWDKWAKAKYSQYKEFRCPSTEFQGTRATPYGWNISSSYMQMAGWSSQPQMYGAEWPTRMAYFPRFRITSQAVILFENWTCNGMTTDASARALPYSTHYTFGSKGPMGIGRNILFADWHISFRKCIDGPDVYTGGGWCCGSTYVPGTSITRGNENGMTWVWDGRTYTAWGPTLPDG